MTYVVLDACIKCKFTDCVEVCPVDCFKEGENMLVIDPEECIDCGVCEPECPIEAISSDSDLTNENEVFLELNAKYSKIWPTITSKKDPLPDSSEFENVENKLDNHFSENPGDGE